MTDGRYFAWVHNICPGMEPKLYPQLIIDVGIANYLINHQNTQAKLNIVARHVLALDEYHLGLDQLIEKYPAPKEIT